MSNKQKKQPAAVRARNERAIPSAPAISPHAQAILCYALFPACLLTTIVFLCVCPIEEYDLWFHFAFARQFVEHGEFLGRDIFSFTSFGREWISTGWLSSVILYWLFEKIGHGSNLAGLTLFVFIQVLVSAFAIYSVALRRKVESAMTLLLMVCLLTACLRFNPRPDLCSQIMVVVVLLLLVTSEDVTPRGMRRPSSRSTTPNAAGDRRLWLLPFLMALWANLHAGFMAGAALIAIYGLHRFMNWRRFGLKSDLMATIPCAVSMVAWLANPYGYRMLTLPSKISAVPGIREMLFEWMPLYSPNGNNLPWFIYAGLALLITLCCAALLTRRTKLPWWHVAAAVFCLAIAWQARRQLGITAWALPIFILPHLEGAEYRLRKHGYLAPALAITGCAALCCMQYGGNLNSSPGWPTVKFLPGTYPEGAKNFLLRHPPPSNIFNSYHYGGFLMYHLGPQTKVFIDGRIDTYDPKVWLDDRAIERGSLSIDEACDRYGLKTFVLDRREGYDPGRLAQRLAARPDIATVFKDDTSAVFVRKTPETAEYISKTAEP